VAARHIGTLARFLFGRLLVRPPPLNFAEQPLLLHFALQYTQRLIHIVVTDNYFYNGSILQPKISSSHAPHHLYIA